MLSASSAQSSAPRGRRCPGVPDGTHDERRVGAVPAMPASSVAGTVSTPRKRRFPEQGLDRDDDAAVDLLAPDEAVLMAGYAAVVMCAVVFDVGECLVDETRKYGTWADWLDVPRHTFHAMFGAVIAQGCDHREVFQEFCPGFDLYEEHEKRVAAGQPEIFGEEDLYASVRLLWPNCAPKNCGWALPGTRRCGRARSCSGSPRTMSTSSVPLTTGTSASRMPSSSVASPR